MARALTILALGVIEPLWAEVGITLDTCKHKSSPLDDGDPTTSDTTATPLLNSCLVLKVPIGTAPYNIHNLI